MGKQNTWMKFRHKVITALLRPPLGLYVRWKYCITVEPFRDHRPCLILMNHQTGFDQFFVAMAVNHPVYYLATEDIFSMGWVSDLIRWLVAPIPIKKQTTDLQAVKNCIRVAREGGTLCIAPEGHRTFHGKTVYIKPSIASLAKKLGLPIAIFRIDGGYGIQPRWSDVVRGGHMKAAVTRVIEPEEYKDLSAEELFRIIERELYVDEVKITGEYPHKKNAEFLERLVYTCPDCGFAPFESNGDIVTCQVCGKQIRHLANKELRGIGWEFPHRFVYDWYEAQNNYVNQANLTELTQAPVFTDTANVSRVHLYSHKEPLKKDAVVCLYGNKITVDGREFAFDKVDAVTVLGKNKLNIYDGDEILQLKGSKRFNAVKYLNFYHRYTNILKGENNGQFLGL